MEPPNHYTISNGEVTDNYTGLIWQQVYSATTMAWSAAAGYCASLGLNGNTWRVPSLNEALHAGKRGCGVPRRQSHGVPQRGVMRHDHVVFGSEGLRGKLDLLLGHQLLRRIHGVQHNNGNAESRWRNVVPLELLRRGLRALRPLSLRLAAKSLSPRGNDPKPAEWGTHALEIESAPVIVPRIPPNPKRSAKERAAGARCFESTGRSGAEWAPPPALSRERTNCVCNAARAAPTAYAALQAGYALLRNASRGVQRRSQHRTLADKHIVRTCRASKVLRRDASLGRSAPQRLRGLR